MIFKKVRPAHEYKPESLPGVAFIIREFTAGEVLEYSKGFTKPLELIAAMVERVEGLSDPDGKPVKNGKELSEMLAQVRGTPDAITFVSNLVAKVYELSRLDEETEKN